MVACGVGTVARLCILSTALLLSIGFVVVPLQRSIWGGEEADERGGGGGGGRGPLIARPAPIARPWFSLVPASSVKQPEFVYVEDDLALHGVDGKIAKTKKKTISLEEAQSRVTRAEGKLAREHAMYQVLKGDVSGSMSKQEACLGLNLLRSYFANQALYDAHQEDGVYRFRPSGDLVRGDAIHIVVMSDNLLGTTAVINSAMRSADDPAALYFHIVTAPFMLEAMVALIAAENTIRRANVEVKAFREDMVTDSLLFTQYGRNENVAKFSHPLNYLRFYIPSIYPELDRVIFLDDDVVIRRDLRHIWDMPMKEGVVQLSVRDCSEDRLLRSTVNLKHQVFANFSFDPNYCRFVYGFNLIDLRAWRKYGITSSVEWWLRKQRDAHGQLWSLGSLPVAMLALYGRTEDLPSDWHAAGFGMVVPTKSNEDEQGMEDIGNGGVLHYNGVRKPWLQAASNEMTTLWWQYIDVHQDMYAGCNFRNFDQQNDAESRLTELPT